MRLLKMDFQALAERLKDAPDSGPNGQLPLATLKDQHKALTVPEILHLLRYVTNKWFSKASCCVKKNPKLIVGWLRCFRNKVVAGRELPPQLTAPPWRVPSNHHPKASMINAVLSKSMEVQSSHVPECHGHGDFQVSAYVIKMKFANCKLILHLYGQYVLLFFCLFSYHTF